MFVLKQRLRISERQAKELIFAFIRHGEYPGHEQGKNLNNYQIKEWVEQNGYKFSDLINNAKDWNFLIPIFETISFNESVDVSVIGAIDNNFKVIATDVVTGEVKKEIQGSGVIILEDYRSKFSAALRHKQRAIDNSDLEEFYTCLEKGFAAFESYFNKKAEYHNKLLGKQELVDTRVSPVSIEEKMKYWVPIISNGGKLDLGKKAWVNFRKLKKLRDECGAHPKHSAQGMSYEDFSKGLNEFRDSVAKLLFDLHVLFHDRMKSNLIREVFSPDIYLGVRE